MEDADSDAEMAAPGGTMGRTFRTMSTQTSTNDAKAL